MAEDDPHQAGRTPTDPSLEFDAFEAARLRLAEALMRHDYDRIEAERIALYVVSAARPLSRLLKVVNGVKAPTDKEVIEALSQAMDETAALEKAKRLLLRLEAEVAD